MISTGQSITIQSKKRNEKEDKKENEKKTVLLGPQLSDDLCEITLEQDESGTFYKFGAKYLKKEVNENCLPLFNVECNKNGDPSQNKGDTISCKIEILRQPMYYEARFCRDCISILQKYTAKRDDYALPRILNTVQRLERYIKNQERGYINLSERTLTHISKRQEVFAFH